jgi:hypothetical protein
MSEDLARYLREVASQLDVDPSRQREILAEIRDHLEEAVADLEEQGRSRKESVALTLERFGEAREVGRMLSRVHGDPLWVRVGWAILPGLFALASAGGLLSALLGASIGGAIGHTGLIGVCVLVIGAGLVREHRLALWSYPACGVLLFHVWWGIPWPSVGQAGSFWSVAPPLIMLAGLAIIAALAAYRAFRGSRPLSRRLGWTLVGLVLMVAMVFPAGSVLADRNADWGSVSLTMLPLSLWWMGLLLLPVVIGMPLARRSGVAAGLMVVAAQYVLWEEIFDPASGILIFTSDHAAARALSSLPALAFLVVPPVWVLLSRRTTVRFWGLVLPPVLGLLSVSVIRAGVLQGTAIEYATGRWLTDFIAGAQLVMLFALTGLIYHRLRPPERNQGEPVQSGASGSMSWSYATDERRA